MTKPGHETTPSQLSRSRSSPTLRERLLGKAGGLRAQLVQGSVGSLAVRGIYVLLQLLTGVLLARVLGPEDLGVYSFALAVVGLLVIPAQLGFPSFFLRMAAVYRAQEELGLVRWLVARGTQVVSAAAVGIALLYAMSLWVYGSPPGAMPTRPLLISAALIPAIALLGVNRGALAGLGHVVLGQVPGHVIRPAALLLAVGATHLVTALTAEAAIAVNLVATVAALALGWLLWLRWAPTEPMGARREGRTREWIVAAFPFLLLAGAQVLNYQADILMLGFLVDRSDVGMYRVAVQIAEALGMTLLAVSAVIAPSLAGLHERGEWRALRRILVSAHRAGVAVILPVALALTLGGEPFLRFVFGDEYVPASSALTVLVLGKAAYATVGFSGLALSMFGLASVATVVTLVAAAANVGLNLLLIPPMGIVGAAAASASSAFVVSAACTVWMAKRYYGDYSALGLRPRGNEDG